MSEGNRLSYRIEFEADEESLSRSVEDAVNMAKPKIQEMLQSMLEEIGMPEGTHVRPSEAIIPTELFNEIKMLGEKVEEAMSAWDMTTFQAVSTQRTQSKTVEDLIHQASVMLDRTREAGGEIGPVVSTIVSSAVGNLVDILNRNPAQAERILGSEIGSITKRESIWGELASSLRSLSEVMKLAEGYERGLSDVEDLKATENLAASSVAHERLKDIAMSIMRERDPEALIKSEVRVDTLFDWLGVSRDQALEIFKEVAVDDPTLSGEDIEKALDAFDKIRFDILQISEEGVRVGEVKPILASDEKRSVPGRNIENRMIQKLLEDNDVRDRLIERLPALRDEENKEFVPPKDIRPDVKGEMFAFRATSGSSEDVRAKGWDYTELKDTAVSTIQWQMAALMREMQDKITEMVDEGVITERVGSFMTSTLTSHDISRKIVDIKEPSETLRVSEPTTKSESASIPDGMVTLFNQLLRELSRVADGLEKTQPEAAQRIRGLVDAGRDMDMSEYL